MLRCFCRYGLSFCALLTLITIVAGGVTTRACQAPNKTEIAYRGAGGRLDEIYNELVSCPNVTSLDLDFVWSGCVAPSDPWQFDFHPGDRFPALNKLSLVDYDFGVPRAPWIERTGMRRFVSNFFDVKQLILSSIGLVEYDPLEHLRLADNYLEARSGQSWDRLNLDKWRQAMDFSQIESLHLEQEAPVFYEVMKDELPSLKHLSFDWSSSGPSVPVERVEFIRGVPSLESLSITIGPPYYDGNAPKNRTRFPLFEILNSHGSSLQMLSLKQLESREPDFRRPMLSSNNVDAMRESCPKLNHLCLDIDRNETHGWPNETLNAITAIEPLTSLTLRLEVGADLHSGEGGKYAWNPQGIDGPGPYREPRMTLEVAEQLFEDLQSRKAGEPLDRVDFVVGDFENKPYSGPIYSPDWDEGRARLLTCVEAPSDGEQVGSRCAMLGDEDPWDDEMITLEGIDIYY